MESSEHFSGKSSTDSEPEQDDTLSNEEPPPSRSMKEKSLKSVKSEKSAKSEMSAKSTKSIKSESIKSGRTGASRHGTTDLDRQSRSESMKSSRAGASQRGTTEHESIKSENIKSSRAGTSQRGTTDHKSIKSESIKSSRAGTSRPGASGLNQSSEGSLPEMPQGSSDERFASPLSVSSQPGASVSSSMPKFGAGKEVFEGLPRNCSYETKKLDWKKVYSPPEGGQGELVLLKDQRCETDFTYTRGNMEATGDVTVSDTDIISHGLNVLLKTKDESTKSIQLPNLRSVLNLMQLTPEELSAVQEWLDQKYELGLQYERETQALIAFVKKILFEVKSLRKSISKYRQQIHKLEKDISSQPDPEILADLYKESERLRKEIAKLDQQHGNVIRSKAQLQRSLQMEFENCFKSENSLYLQIQNLKYENKTLRHLVEVFTTEARDISNDLLKRFEISLKTIKKLNGFLLRARNLLEKKSRQTKEVEMHLQDQDKLIKGIVDSIDFIQEHIINLRSDVSNMQDKSANLTSHAVNIQNEIQELLGNFNSITSHLTTESELEAEKKKNVSQVKQILDSLDAQKKNVKKLEKNINKLEKHIQASEAKDRKVGGDIVSNNEKENIDEKQTWDEKITKLRNYFEEVDEIMMNIREEEAERKKAMKEAAKKEAVGEAFSNAGEEVVKLSGRFICSDATAGEVVTKSGVCNIAESGLLQQSDIKFADSPEFGRGVRSAYAVGLQNLTSVPESPKSQLHGIYTKYKLKDSEEATAS